MHIVYVSDGKAGHRSQALGLFQAMQRQQPETTFEEILISDLPIISLIQALFSTKIVIKSTRFYIWSGKPHTFSCLVTRQNF